MANPAPNKNPNSPRATWPKLKKGQQWVTLKEMQTLTGFSQPSLSKWRRQFDDFPTPHPETHCYRVKEIEAFFEAHSELGQPGHRITGDRETLMCENLRLKNEVLQNTLAEQDRRSVNIDRVVASFTTERTILVAAFRKRLLSEMPSELEGLTAREMAPKLQDAFNNFLSDVQNSVDTIIKSTFV